MEVPYSHNGPIVKQYLSTSNLDNLPMFNPLSERAYIPRDTIFPPVPFFQAQGSLQPRLVHKCTNKIKLAREK